MEQKSIAIRYTDSALQPREEFLGFYCTSSGTDTQAMTHMICDVMLRLNLPISMLCGQTYDGASNMSVKFSGTQALIAGKQPLAVYVHCLMHCGNSVAQSILESSAPIRDAISMANDAAVFSRQSTKLSNVLKEVKNNTTSALRCASPSTEYCAEDRRSNVFWTISIAFRKLFKSIPIRRQQTRLQRSRDLPTSLDMATSSSVWNVLLLCWNYFKTGTALCNLAVNQWRQWSLLWRWLSVHWMSFDARTNIKPYLKKLSSCVAKPTTSSRTATSETPAQTIHKIQTFEILKTSSDMSSEDVIRYCTSDQLHWIFEAGHQILKASFESIRHRLHYEHFNQSLHYTALQKYHVKMCCRCDSCRHSKRDCNKSDLHCNRCNCRSQAEAVCGYKYLPCSHWGPVGQYVGNRKQCPLWCSHPGPNVTCLQVLLCLESEKTCLQIWNSMLGQLCPVIAF